MGLPPVVEWVGTTLDSTASSMSTVTSIMVILGGRKVSRPPTLARKRTTVPTGRYSRQAIVMFNRLVVKLTTIALVPNRSDIPCPEVLTVWRTLTLPACLRIETRATILTTTEDIIKETVMKVTSIQATVPTTAAIEDTTSFIQLAQVTWDSLLMLLPQVVTVLLTILPLVKAVAHRRTVEGDLKLISFSAVRPLLQAELEKARTPLQHLVYRAAAQAGRVVLKVVVSRGASTVATRRAIFVVHRVTIRRLTVRWNTVASLLLSTLRRHPLTLVVFTPTRRATVRMREVLTSL